MGDGEGWLVEGWGRGQAGRKSSGVRQNGGEGAGMQNSRKQGRMEEEVRQGSSSPLSFLRDFLSLGGPPFVFYNIQTRQSPTQL